MFPIYSNVQGMPLDESILDVELAVRVLVRNNEYYDKLFVQQQGTGDEYRVYCQPTGWSTVSTEQFRSQQVARVKEAE